MASINTVAIAGATGYLGPAIVKSLQNSGKFDVTLLVRASSSTAQLDNIKTAVVDYEDPSSLIKAPQALVKASVIAGVKRFIPSEYGVDMRIPAVQTIPYLAPKAAIQDMLNKSSLTYSYLYTGPFLEWGIEYFFLDWKSSTSEIWDGGDIRIGVTIISDVGRAVHLWVVSAVLSQNEILSTVKECCPDLNLTLHNRDIKATFAADQEAWKAGRGLEPEIIRDSIGPCLYGLHIESGIQFNKDNQLLGIEKLTKDELKDIVATVVKTGGPTTRWKAGESQ
ncbi:hypothetical protein GGI35DRAFT_471945 [Trichoderma velutinum]